MVVFRRGLALLVYSNVVFTVLAVVMAQPARADSPGMCRVIGLGFTAGGITAGTRPPPGDTTGTTLDFFEATPQIVAWIESPTGQYLHTVYITQQSGRYGLGNRPGRFDFNSGPAWPYGRRITVFPVWSHRNGGSFPELQYQDEQDSNLSHSSDTSSPELHYCRPIMTSESMWDAATCATPSVFTDKGKFSTGTTGYPPRADVVPTNHVDSPSVAMYKAMNPFDAVSQATPPLGAKVEATWPIPSDLIPGNYVMFVEVALEEDFNNFYSPAMFPSPAMIAYGGYGVPYRGQPSVVYKVPFTISDADTVATVTDYFGYGDPTGADGTIRPPDSSITSGTPNTGAERLLLTSDSGSMYRLRISSHVEQDLVAPSAPGTMIASDPSGNDVTLSFAAPGDDGTIGTVTGYDVRYQVGDVAITDANFNTAVETKFTGAIVPAGQPQNITVKGLLPETQYTFAVRAFDECNNTGPITTTTFTTPQRLPGEVDACFVATAAYGSRLANDVEMLRRFRDMMLRRTALGELAVETYYTFGPAIAGIVGQSDLLRATARDALTPIVNRVRGLRW